MESRFTEGVIRRLRSLGHEVDVLADFDEMVGHAAAIVRDPSGVFEGGCDPRSNGGVAGF